MEAKATHKYLSSSPRKMRLVIDLIRGLSVDQAIEILHFSPKHAAKDAEKVLRSAVANLFNKDEESNHEPSDLFVKEVYVNQGPTLKRMLPAPMGRAYRVRKRSNHLTIVVASK
ncbi:LSU ribosomal protein L22p (L17e) [hydrothermal vent metagenome]|uniref:LSU ribosomal protein L22p (L17e) n=1 Tax=hydrothermal vent metagenome TaxID=652676 RepID=A0A3B1C6E7_9ZZZZ